MHLLLLALSPCNSAHSLTPSNICICGIYNTHIHIRIYIIYTCIYTRVYICVCACVLYLHIHLCVCMCVCIWQNHKDKQQTDMSICSKYDNVLIFLLCSGEHQLNERERESLAISSSQEPLMYNTAAHWDHLGALTNPHAWVSSPVGYGCGLGNKRFWEPLRWCQCGAKVVRHWLRIRQYVVWSRFCYLCEESLYI